MVAIRGSGSPHFGFAGHLDVVPPGEGWATDPFDPVIEDGILTGRGANDMKSAIAAFVVGGRRVAAGQGNALAAHHRRRGRLCHLRHAADHRMAGRARHPPRHDPDRRADLGRPPGRHDQDRAARVGQHVDRRAGHAGPCRLSAPRRQSGAQAGAGRRGARCASSRRRNRGFSALEPRIHRHLDADQRQQRHPGLRDRPAQHPLQRPPARRRPGPAGRGNRRAGGARRHRPRPHLRRSVPDAAGRALRCRRIGDPRGNRHRAGTVDQRRHVRRPFPDQAMPGGRFRPAQRKHAQGRRACGGRRHPGASAESTAGYLAKVFG